MDNVGVLPPLHKIWFLQILTAFRGESKVIWKLWCVMQVLPWVLLLLHLGGGGAAGQERKEKKPVKNWQIMPRLGFALEYGGFLIHDDVFTSMLRRRLEIDVFQYRRHIFYLEFDEETSLGTPSDRWDFNRLRHRLYLGGYRYDLGDYYVGLFYYHRCHNPIYTEKYKGFMDRNTGSLYFLSLEFLSKSMRLGMKNRGINFDPHRPFEFLGRGHIATSVNKLINNIVEKDYADLDWLLRTQIRYDICRYRRLIPYLQVGTEVMVGPSWHLRYLVEGGVRYHIHNMDFTPFFQWGRNQEFLVTDVSRANRLVAQNFLYGGARLEFLLDKSNLAPSPGGRGLQLFPEVHGTAGYALYLRSRYFKGYGNLEFDFEALRWVPWTFFVYTDLKLDSEKTGFRPDKALYGLQYGLSYYWKEYFIEGFMDHRKRVDVLDYSGVSERMHLAGLRWGTQGMKPGHYNDGISFSGPERFQWVNKWDAQGSLGHYFQNRDWQYLWDLAAQVRWNLCRWYFLVPYLQGEVGWLTGGGRTDDAVEYALESGLRFHGELDVALYHRFQHRENVRFFRGPGENQSLIGIKALF